MRYIALVLALLATPASAKDITITLNDAEQKALMSMLDIALKSGGLQNLQAVVGFVAKVQAAAKEEPVTPEPEAPKP